MRVTRTILAATVPALLPICKTAGFMRADIWRRYGALGTHAQTTTHDIRKDFAALYGHLLIDGTIRNETAKDAINDIFTYRAAAMAKVEQAIFRRTNDETERKRLFALLKRGEWLSDPFLHRQMRKHFRHGVSHARNQFIVRSDKFTTGIINGKLVVTIHIASKFGEDIILVTTTSGKNVDLSGCNLRIVVKGAVTEIHYAIEKDCGRPHGEGSIGVDKGYTEAFADSRGEFHGQGFGVELRAFSDAAHKTGIGRNKLYSLEKKHREAGRIAKADRIRRNNLGTKKLIARRKWTQVRLRNIAFKAAHSIVDKAVTIGAEDLTSPIARRTPWKGFNRRMGFWAKGVLAEALGNVTEQRGACLVHVNAAYTSQIDSQTGLLEGKRVGDRFHHVSGDVSSADTNAAVNVEDRMRDPEITRYMPYKQVERILLSRSSGATERQEGRVGIWATRSSTDCGQTLTNLRRYA
jgi:hypothetical protein